MNGGLTAYGWIEDHLLQPTHSELVTFVIKLCIFKIMNTFLSAMIVIQNNAYDLEFLIKLMVINKKE